MRNPTGSPREWEIAATYCRYGCHKDAAVALGLRETTVGNHLANLYRKYSVTSLFELLQIAGWLEIPADNMPLHQPEPIGLHLGSPREWEVFAAYCRWGCGKDAAQAVRPPVRLLTVKSTMESLYHKYGVHRASELAQAIGWLVIPPDNMPRLSAPVSFPRDITAATLSGCKPSPLRTLSTRTGLSGG